MDHSGLTPEAPFPGPSMPSERPRGRRIKEPTPPTREAVPATYPGTVPGTGGSASSPTSTAGTGAVAPPPPFYVAPLAEAVPVVDIAPLDVDGVRTVAVGTGLWALALMALLPFYGWLADTGRTWWIWTCCAGIGLGLLGLEYCRSQRDRAAHSPGVSDPASAGGRRRL